MARIARFKTLIAATLLATGFAGAQQAQADQATCIATADMAPLLQHHYGETLRFVGVLSNQNVVEVFQNAGSQSWTVAVSIPDRGQSCVIASGTDQYALNTRLRALKTL